MAPDGDRARPGHQVPGDPGQQRPLDDLVRRDRGLVAKYAAIAKPPIPPQPLARRTCAAARGWPATLGPSQHASPPLPFLPLPCFLFLAALDLARWIAASRLLSAIAHPLRWSLRRSRLGSWPARRAGPRTRSGSVAGGRASSICSNISARLPSSRMRTTRAIPWTGVGAVAQPHREAHRVAGGEAARLR